MDKPTFKMVVIANNLSWSSLQSKLFAIRDFYAPVCELDISVVKTTLQPVFRLPGGLNVIETTWYDAAIARYAADADIALFICPATDHRGILTYAGYMNNNNIGPWETTIFVNGENDRLYGPAMKDYGDEFTIVAMHELSHAFYAMTGLPDNTHAHFPNTPQAPQINNDDPNMDHVLFDFGVGFNNGFFKYQRLKDKLLEILAALNLLSKKNIATVADRAHN